MADERDILRALAARVRALADEPRMAALRKRWTRHNALESVGPLVLCFPEGAWGEILPEAALSCADPQLRQWERNLRMQLWTAETLRDDQVLEPWFDLNWRVSVGDYGVPVVAHRGEGRGSFKYEHPLTDLPKDLERLHHRELTVDRDATQADLERAEALFGDLLPPRLRGGFWWTLGLTWEAIKLIGLETLMMAPYDQPEALHRLMAWLRDEHLVFIDWFEREGLLSDQNGAEYTGSGGLAFTDELPRPGRPPGAPARLIDRWGFAESQETVGVSPAMFREFILPYQVPLLEKFGLNCYGCCEGLHDRIDDVLRIPRLRRVSVSPWADEAVMAAKLAGRAVYSRKPNPSLLCVDFQEQALRDAIRGTLAAAGSCAVEFVMKDTHTVQNEPDRLVRWVRLCREEIAALG